jgi:hypothetical protein
VILFVSGPMTSPDGFGFHFFGVRATGADVADVAKGKAVALRDHPELVAIATLLANQRSDFGVGLALRTRAPQGDLLVGPSSSSLPSHGLIVVRKATASNPFTIHSK